MELNLRLPNFILAHSKGINAYFGLSFYTDLLDCINEQLLTTFLNLGLGRWCGGGLGATKASVQEVAASTALVLERWGKRQQENYFTFST